MKNQGQILNWLKEAKVKTNKGLPIEFGLHGFLLDYLLDNANRIVVRKPTQVGISFTTLLKILYLGYNKSLTFIYTLPTSQDAKDFVLQKLEPIIERSPALRSKVIKVPFKDKAVYSSSIKRLGDSYYFFRGSYSSRRAQSIDSDVVVIDELDFQRPDVRKMYEERVEGSSSGDIIYWIGYPSLPNFGIEQLYEQSDQREWFIKCPKCGRLQTLEFPKSISFKKKKYVCKYCGAELSPKDRQVGKWIPKFPGRKIHGYSMNKLMAPWVPASRIIKAYNEEDTKHFYNYTLGLPYVDKSSGIVQSLLDNDTIDKSQEDQMKFDKVLVGIDQGNRFHMVWAKANQDSIVVQEAFDTKDYNELEQKVLSLHPDFVVIDSAPDYHIAKKLQSNLPNICFLGILRTWSIDSKKKNYFTLQRSKGIINIERTESLDGMVEALQSKRLLFKKTAPRLSALFSHLKNLVPDYQERYGILRKVWKYVGPDHFGHALNFLLVGANIVFPMLDFGSEMIVPSGVLHEDIKIKRPGVAQDDFERTIEKVSNNSNSIIIPPKNF